MPLDRPYRNEGLDTLYGRARDYWGNVAFLQLILDELAHRTTSAAKSIHAEVSERIAALLEAQEASAPHPDPLLDEVTRLRAEKSIAENEIAELRAALVQAREAIRWQERKLAASAEKGGHPTYRRVGLDEECPDFVLKAVRTAYRKHFHPDARPAHEKAEAERRFKEAEAVFDTLFALRKL